MASEITDESVTGGPFSHDVGKLDVSLGNPTTLLTTANGRSRSEASTTKLSLEPVTMNLAVRSLQVVSSFILLTKKEVHLVVGDDGV